MLGTHEWRLQKCSCFAISRVVVVEDVGFTTLIYVVTSVSLLEQYCRGRSFGDKVGGRKNTIIFLS